MNLLKSIVNQAIGLLGDLLMSLIELPQTPEAIQRARAFEANLRGNQKRLGDVRAVLLGQVRYHPAFWSEPYTEIVDHDQYCLGVFDAGVGTIDVQAFVGARPFAEIPGSQLQVCRPGERQALCHPNVRTDPDVKSVEMRGGGTGFKSVTTVASFESGGRITQADGDFNNTRPGTWATVVSPPAQAGRYFVLDCDRDGRWLQLDTTFTPTVDVEGTFELVLYTSNDESLLVEDVALTLATDGTITGPAGSMSNVLVGDLIGVLGSDDNSALAFTVIGTDYDGVITVEPAPVAESIDGGSLQLLQRPLGWYYPIPKTKRATRIGYDVACPSGLGNKDLGNGSVDDWSFSLLVEWQEIDDSDLPTGSINTYIETYTDHVLNKPRRWSRYLALSDQRVRMRFTRLTSDYAGDDGDKISTSQLIGLRAYLSQRPGETWDVDPDGTCIAVRVRASGVVSNLNDPQFAIVGRAYTPVYDGSTWTDQLTSNPWWLALQFAVSQSRGRLTRDAFDLTAIQALADDADGRGITFNAVVDAEVALMDTLQQIVRADRGRLVRDRVTGRLTGIRDTLRGPDWLFASGINSTLAPPAIETASTDNPTGLRLKITDPSTGTERDDTPIVGADLRLDEREFWGCDSWSLMWAELYYQWYQQRYRAITTTLTGEMDTTLVHAGQRVLVASPEFGWGWGGEVAAVSGLTLTLSQALQWVTGASHYLYLQDADGTPSARLAVTRGSADNIAILAAAPGVTLRTGSGRRTVFVAGREAFGGTRACEPRQWIVLSAESDSEYAGTLQLVNDDARVYADPPPVPPDPREPVTGSVPALELDSLTLTVTT